MKNFLVIKSSRPGLSECLDYARVGDTTVVWWLDRLGRSLKDLITLVGELDKKIIGFKSLNKSIDTSNSSGKLIFHIFGALAEFERNLIKGRTVAGLEAARSRGRVGGRPNKLTDEILILMKSLYKEKKHSIKDICELVGISRQTLYNYLSKTNTKQ